jgi:hypothetical protein
MTQHNNTAPAREAVTGEAARLPASPFVPRRNWRMFASVAAVGVALAWMSLPGAQSQREINVHLATFAFRV